MTVGGVYVCLLIILSLCYGIIITPLYNTSGVYLRWEGPNSIPLTAKFNGVDIIVVLYGNSTSNNVLQGFYANNGKLIGNCKLSVVGMIRGSLFIEEHTNIVVFSSGDGNIHGWPVCKESLAWSSNLNGGYYYGVKQGAPGVALTLTGNSAVSTLFAVDTSSGKVLWSRQSDINFPSVGCELVWTVESNGTSTFLVGRDPVTGVPSPGQPGLVLTMKPFKFAGSAFRCATASTPLIYYYSCTTAGQTGLCAVGGATWHHFPYFQNLVPNMWPTTDPREPNAVYASSSDCWMRAFDANNGTVRWESGGACGVMSPILPTNGPLANKYVVYGSAGSVRIYDRVNGTTMWTGPPVRFFSNLVESNGDFFLVTCNTLDCGTMSLLRWQASDAVEGPQPNAEIVIETWNNTICRGAGNAKGLNASPCDAGFSRTCTPFGALSTTRFSDPPNCAGAIVDVRFDYPDHDNVPWPQALCRQTVWGSYILLKCAA